MTEGVQVALIVAIPPTVASLASVIVSLITHQKVEIVRKEANGMKSELVALTRKDAHAKGMSDQRQRDKKGR